MVWFSILKYYKRDSDGSYSWFNWKDYDSRRRADKQNKNREDFLKIIANNAELELPEIEQRAAEAEKKETELLNTIKDMDKKYNNSLSKLTAKRDERQSMLDQTPYGQSYVQDKRRFEKQVEGWNNKIEAFKEQYKKQISTFKDAAREQRYLKDEAEQDLEKYRRYNQSGKEFMNMAKEYGWNLPDELDSFLRTLDVIHGVTPEAIEGIIGLMPSETEEQDDEKWKDGLRRTDIPMQDENTIMLIINQLISRGIAPKDITKYNIHDELGIDHKDLGAKWNKKDDEQLDRLIEMRAKSYRPMSEAERKWRGL